MVTSIKKFYDVGSVLRERVTDFAIMREEPIVFKAGDRHIVCCPISYHEHYDFLNDIASMFVEYNTVFSTIDFISSTNFRDGKKRMSMIEDITVFSATAEYKRFIRKGLPEFLIKWALKVKNNKLKKLSRRDIKKFLVHFTIDELLEMFLTLYNFNYSIVKKKTFDFLRQLRGGPPSQGNTTSSSNGTRKVVKMPKFSEKPYSKSTLNLMREQSKIT